VSSDQEKVVSITKVIARQADRLRSLFDQVLNITSMQDLQLAKSDHSLHLLLDEILLDYRLKINDPNVSITLHAAAEHDMIQVDNFWLTTMLNNIFDNAIRYNKRQQKQIFVNTFNESRKLVLVIKDNGIGMDENTRSRVFDKFYRHGDVLGTKGLGLGLYYVKQCVAAHGWDISIESEPDRGSQFIITIPI
jgi:two-component system phosphate regulon sensor histidine kinase PhoR